MLLPSMLQSIEVLQLTTVDLLRLIDAELEQNETLEAKEPKQQAEEQPAEAKVSEDDFDAGLFRQLRSAEEDSKQAFLNNVPAAVGQNLQEFIRQQLVLLGLDDALELSVLSLAEFLDSRGLLTVTEAELLGHFDAEMLAAAREVLQSLEPRGIGAENGIAAMLMQLPKRDPDYDDIRSMLTKHLSDLAKNKLPQVAKTLGRTVSEIRELLGRIEQLNPRPAAAFQADDLATIHPDVVVRLVDGEIEVTVDEMVLPDLGVSQDYWQMARTKGLEGEVKKYLTDKLRSARDLITAVEQRKRTLARVTAAIMEFQREFLESGAEKVKTLGMAQVADLLGMHLSTVSRAIAGKFVQTDRGIFPLRVFFDGGGGTSTEQGGSSDKGRLAVKEQIRAMIADENPGDPLSDEEIVRALASKNLVIARRTVAKYRKELGLSSSWRRRRH